MVKVVLGLKGSGKTKKLIESINETVKNDAASVVCIEKGNALKYDVNYRCRLIDASEYQIEGYALLKGFICGLHAGNFDISHIYIDSFKKIIGEPTNEETDAFLQWCEKFGADNKLDFTISLSVDPAEATETMKKYL